MDVQPSRYVLSSLNWHMPEVERVLPIEFDGTQQERYAQRKALEDSLLLSFATMPA